MELVAYCMYKNNNINAAAVLCFWGSNKCVTLACSLKVILMVPSRYGNKNKQLLYYVTLIDRAQYYLKNTNLTR